MPMQQFTAFVHREEDAWVAICPELDVASQGNSVEQAKANLREAVELFLESADPAEVRERLAQETFISPLEVRVG